MSTSPSTPVENPYAGQGAVMLDIGPDTGAIVVTAPLTLVGAEVAFRRIGDRTPSPVSGHEHSGQTHHDHDHDHDHDHGLSQGHGHSHVETHVPHVGVVARPTPRGERLASIVIPDLAPGRYVLGILPENHPAMTIEVHAGSVAVAEWPTAHGHATHSHPPNARTSVA